MDVALFERCIKFISETYNTVLFEELIFSDLIKSKSKFATIMFDDGYKDNIAYAAPILKKYNCKASFYVVTNCIDKHIQTWTYILEHLFQNTSVSKIEMSFEFLPRALRVTELSSYEPRIDYVAKLKPILKKISHQQREVVLQHVVKTYSDVEIPRIMMNWSDLNQLQSEGHCIGSHTVSHAMLGTMVNDEEQKKELEDSAFRIKNQTGKFPVTISYPVGSFNDATKEISKDAGYKFGLAVKQKIFNPGADDLFEIPRIELYNEPWWKTRLRITHTLEKIKSVVGYN